jgi:TolB-like protein
MPPRGSPRNVVLQLGIADTLINRLSVLSEIVVTPTHAVMPFLGDRADALAARRKLGVDAVVEGNIQRQARRIRCTVRLLRVSDGTAIWVSPNESATASTRPLTGAGRRCPTTARCLTTPPAP